LGTRSVAGLVTILLALLSASLWSVAAAPLVSAATGGCGADMGTRQVVVLVHGFNSDATTWTKSKPAMLAAVSGADPGNVYVRLFDYGTKSTQWVTDPAIGPALASFVGCLAQASSAAGGSGKVILVGHSMGGLAIRCALNLACSPHPVGKDQVGLVVTIGTPNAGSQIRPGSTADQADLILGETLLSLCDIAQIANGYEWLTNTCQFVSAMGVSPAAQAFTIGSHELATLPPYPAGIPVRAIAGAITLQTGIEIGNWQWQHPLPMGDLVVGVKSQLLLHTNDRLGGTRTVNCGTANTSVEPACSHITETAFPGIQGEVRQAIKDYLAASSPVLETVTRRGKNASPRFAFDISLPVLVKAPSAITARWQGEVERIEAEKRTSLAAWIARNNCTSPSTSNCETGSTLGMRWLGGTLSNQYASAAVVSDYYATGAGPDQNDVDTITMSLKSGKELKLTDVIDTSNPSFVSAVVDAMKGGLAAGGQLPSKAPNRCKADLQGNPVLNNFTVDVDGITFWFNKYEVAAGACSGTSVTLNWAAAEPYLTNLGADLRKAATS